MTGYIAAAKSCSLFTAGKERRERIIQMFARLIYRFLLWGLCATNLNTVLVIQVEFCRSTLGELFKPFLIKHRLCQQIKIYSVKQVNCDFCCMLYTRFLQNNVSKAL